MGRPLLHDPTSTMDEAQPVNRPSRRGPQADPDRPARRIGGRPLAWAAVGLAVAAGVAAGLVWNLSRPVDPDRLWAEAERDLRAGRFDEARAALRRIGHLRPKEAQDWVLQAQLDTAAGATDDALAALARVPDDHPLGAQARLLAGRLERARHRLRPAEVAFRRALAIEPDLVDAHKELIYVYGVQLRRREVDAEFRALSRLVSLDHHDLFTWALTHFTTWHEDVIRDLESFVAADPDDRHSRLALMENLVDRPGTGERVEKLLEGLPRSDPDALAIRVRLAIHRGRLDDAEALLRDAPKGHPKLARLRGKLALYRRDLDAAGAHFREALSAEPFDRTSTFELGQALRLQGDEAGAEFYLERFRRLRALYGLVSKVSTPERENQPPDLFAIGRACEEAGLLDEARGWYLLAISRDPLDSRSQGALQRLPTPEG